MSSDVARVGTTKGINEQLVAGREAVTILHAITTKQFANDPMFLAGWNNTRRVQDKVGAVRKAKDVGTLSWACFTLP